MQFQDGERLLLFNKQQEARVLCEDLLIKVRHNKEKAGGGLRQERGRRLALARGNSRNVVIERQRGERRSCEEAERATVQIDHVHISQLDADGGFRLLNAKCNSAALTGLIHIQKCHAVVGLLVQDK